MNKEITTYNNSQSAEDKKICNELMQIIDKNLPTAESKVWHAHPVWFIEGNPIVGYSKLKAGIRLMFWSGASFDEDALQLGTGKFKDASITYTSSNEINAKDIQRWLRKSIKIQWDYKNIIKRKGKLVRLS
jgi:hypothetical protein